ncbi:hypothetical protein AAG906_015188 [Vitis piasezkii]
MCKGFVFSITIEERESERECMLARALRENHLRFRKSSKGRSFRVGSKVFEIEVEKKKGRMQAIILGPESLEFLLESLTQCNKEVKAGRWERGWKENGRSYSLRRKGTLVYNGGDVTEYGSSHCKTRKKARRDDLAEA